MWKIVCGATLAIPAIWHCHYRCKMTRARLKRFNFAGASTSSVTTVLEEAGKRLVQGKEFCRHPNGGFDFVRVNLFVFDHMDAQIG